MIKFNFRIGLFGVVFFSLCTLVVNPLPAMEASEIQTEETSGIPGEEATELPAEDKKALPQEPINITSDQLEADKSAGLVVFRGNVVAIQKDATIMSAVLTVFYDDSSKIEKIVAEGDVRINQADRVGTCQLATFYPDEKKIVMEEEPRLWKDSDTLMGDIITIYIDSDKIDVEGAKAIIHPKNSDKKENSFHSGNNE